MKIEYVRIELRLPYTKSLKEKRKIIKSLLSKTREKFNISIIEQAFQDHINFATIGYVLLAQNQKQIDQIFEKIQYLLDSCYEIEVYELERSEL